MDVAIEALRAGAYDFLNKPVDSEVLVHTIRRACQHRALSEEVTRLRKEVASQSGFGELLGESSAMRKLYAVLEKLARTDGTVLVYGETGTGKELVARGLHDKSRRKDGPFVALNCAALPSQLIESELFGHTKGAFTDAKSNHTGLFVQAHGGTLFLDEIGELPLELQPKLLRTLQERSVRPVGATSDVPVDVRVIAATHRDLEDAVDRQAFRQDLLFRINVIQVDLPPLRDRGNDLLLLAQHFIHQCNERLDTHVQGLSTSAADKLVGYEWPGNVRELQNAIERAVTLAEHDKLVVEDLPERIRKYQSSQIAVATSDSGELVSLDEIERRYITRVFKSVDGNKAQAARVLGVDRKTLYRKLSRYGLIEANGSKEE
jgi:two-component system response regulator HydG